MMKKIEISSFIFALYDKITVEVFMKTTIHTLKNEYKDNQTYLNEKQNFFKI